MAVLNFTSGYMPSLHVAKGHAVRMSNETRDTDIIVTECEYYSGYYYVTHSPFPLIPGERIIATYRNGVELLHLS